MVVMVVFSLVLIGLLSRTQAKSVEVGDRLSKRQGLWTSEAAINQVIRRLEVDSFYRNNPYALSGTLNHVDYEVTVTRNGDEFTILVKTEGSSAKPIQQIVEVSESSLHETFQDYAVFIENGNLYRGDNSIVNGEIWPPLPIDADPIEPSLVPTMPLLDTEYYKVLIDEASVYGITAPPANLVLEGDVLLQGDHGFNSISGEGRLICSGNLSFGSGAIIGPDIEIISGKDLYLSSGVSGGKNVRYFAAGGLRVDIGSKLNVGTILIGLQAVHTGTNVEILGIIYSGGDTLIRSGSQIYGSVVSAQSVTLEANAGITHEPSQFPAETADGLQASEEIQAVTRSWMEL